MSNWISYHIFYFDSVLQEKMIVDCISPLMKKYYKDCKIEKWFFIRYWEGGPHIRLRFLEKENIHDEVLKKLNLYLQDHKSNSSLTKEQYYENHTFDGKEMNQSTLPWYGDNCIVTIDYEREYDRYGGQETIPYCENIFMKSSIFAADLIDATQVDFTKRISVALNLILVFLYQFEMKPAYFFYYYKKVWDDYFHNEKMEYSIIRRLNIEKRLASTRDTMSTNALYRQWSDLLENEVEAIRGINEENPEKVYGIVISLVHMFSNRLGITPAVEREISTQFTNEAKELGYVLEN